MRSSRILTLSACTLLARFPSGESFTLQTAKGSLGARPTALRPPVFLSSTPIDELQDISSMKARDIKEELESYGINTKSFLEKSELIGALEKARADGLKPKKKATTQAKAERDASSSTSSSTSSSSTASTTDTRRREERLKEELEKCRAMKAGELKKELEERGVSTKSFFEKSEFVQALAEARVDGVKKKKGSRGGSSSSDEEGYAEYKNVEVITDENAGPRKRQTEQEPASSSPFGGAAGANPFAGMGGMGGMGGIADMLKNMGGMGGGAAGGSPFGGSSPFGGAAGTKSPFGGGANPFGGGDMFAKAQQLMQNPKVRELMTKAQSNPSLMAKVNECMSNPASFAKYQNDPEVAELISELRKYM